MAVVALVVALVVSAMRPQQDPFALGGEPAGATPSTGAESAFETSSPVAPAPGDVPITMDAKLPGLTIVNPPMGDWRLQESERSSGYTIESSSGDSLLSIRQWTLEPSHYRDQDLTMGEIGNAANLFGDKPQLVGSPGSHWISGSGYRVEFITQRVAWDIADTEALLLSRYMPNTGTRIMIMAFGEEGDLSNPSSPISRKLAEISFTVP